jgi:hypothetical protein
MKLWIVLAVATTALAQERVITLFSGTDIPVFLLNVFAKNEKTDLTPKERRVLKSVLADMAEIYRSRRESR